MFMRFFSKKEPVTRLADWIDRMDGEVTCRKKDPAKDAVFADFPGMDARLKDALASAGIEKLFSHQRKAFDLAAEGRDMVITTPTASGKTLCYNLPVAQALLEEPSSRALYIFPTKALAQDQLAVLKDLSSTLGGVIKAFTYDGDTPRSERRKVRSAANIIITNPDMLHSGILPHHARWANFFANLKYVVTDELHTYRGVFGSHLANLYRRLTRICDFHGSRPVFISCSATIANPALHAAALTGRSAEVISESGAPSSAKEFLIYNTPVLNRRTGLRRSSLFETARIASEAMDRDISAIVFTRSRINVELLLKYLRADLEKRGLDPSSVTGYRGGYLPKERREAERGLRSGRIKGVVTTNALELGVDIGSIDLALLHGYPGSVASVRQQAGRAGRRKGASAAVMIASARPLDQFLAANPRWLTEASPEYARIDPSNPYILVGHVRCSAYELPFREGESFGGFDIEPLLEGLAQNGLLHISHTQEGKLYSWQDDSYPAAEISLRSATGESYAITDVTDPESPKLVGVMDKHSAPTMIFPGAIYFHGGASYHVKELDSEKLQCRVERADTDYYTEGEAAFHVDITEEYESSGSFGWGEALVTSSPLMYKKIKLTTHENAGHGPIDLPQESMETTACWITLPNESENAKERGAAEGLAHLVRNVAPLFLMCDENDMRVIGVQKDPKLRKPALFVVDNIPGGVGLAEGVYEIRSKLFTACMEALENCKCEEGCPACVGVPEEGSGLKSSVAKLTREVIKNLGEAKGGNNG
jgi:DEAD/DEAH box helicase domain-containing protein